MNRTRKQGNNACGAGRRETAGRRFSRKAGMYQCIYCSSFDTEKELACKLLDQVEKNGYTIAGDYLCETIVETPIFEKDERGMFLRLQVPVNVR